MYIFEVDLTTHPIALVYKSLSSIVAPYITEPEIVKGKCSCSERPASVFGYQGYRFEKSNSQHVVHCVQYHSFFVSVPDIMDIEALSKPKFGPWSGVGTLINVATLNAILFAPRVW